jgi:ferredoxin
MAKLSVDKEKCIGCGMCVQLCPASFKLKEGKAIPVKETIKIIKCEKEASENCPVGAIKIV